MLDLDWIDCQAFLLGVFGKWRGQSLSFDITVILQVSSLSGPGQTCHIPLQHEVRLTISPYSTPLTTLFSLNLALYPTDWAVENFSVDR